MLCPPAKNLEGLFYSSQCVTFATHSGKLQRIILIWQNTTYGSQKICLPRIESSATNFGLWLRKLGSKDAALTSLVQRRTLMVKNLFYRTLRSPSELHLS